jgi:serine/threonine-protein kinase HipA
MNYSHCSTVPTLNENKMAKTILVYADWDGLPEPKFIGTLQARDLGRAEQFSFEYSKEALGDPTLLAVPLDPELGLFGGPQYPAHGSDTWGMFADSSPDRWGRMLMKRRFDRQKRNDRTLQGMQLRESDYLVGVHDQYRVGALRYKLAQDGPFLDNQDGTGAPPLVMLRALEAAVRQLENDERNDAPGGDEWIRMLIAPGGSLGGARPKASVITPENRLLIAKFPSTRDTCDIGAWEAIVHTLAIACGLNVSQSQWAKYASEHHTFLTERFDRTADGRRLHFASAMTLTNHTDGDDASTGASYLELAEVLIRHGVQTQADLRELWKRILFNVLVSNTDDHLRNHGFLLEPGKGWKLAPAYDMNPVSNPTGLKLNINEDSNDLDIELVKSVAHHFRVTVKEAGELAEEFMAIIRQFEKIAGRDGLGLSRGEIDDMAPAFQLAM